jgi:hypothetical protein
MLDPKTAAMDPLLQASEMAFADEMALGAKTLSPLRVDLGFLLATRFQAAVDSGKPTAEDMTGLISAAQHLRLALTGTPEAEIGANWMELADFIVDRLTSFSAEAADQDALAAEMVGLAKMTLAATATTDNSATAKRERIMADALFRAAHVTDDAAVAEAARHARRALALYGDLAEPLNTAFAYDTLCSIVSFQAKKAADKTLADEAVASCEKAVALAATDLNGANLKSYLDGQLNAVRKIKADIP